MSYLKLLNNDRLALEFLQKHKDADEIVIDEETKLPVKAVYTTINGQLRIYPATYWFEPLLSESSNENML